MSLFEGENSKMLPSPKLIQKCHLSHICDKIDLIHPKSCFNTLETLCTFKHLEGKWKYIILNSNTRRWWLMVNWHWTARLDCNILSKYHCEELSVRDWMHIV